MSQPQREGRPGKWVPMAKAYAVLGPGASPDTLRRNHPERCRQVGKRNLWQFYLYDDEAAAGALGGPAGGALPSGRFSQGLQIVIDEYVVIRSEAMAYQRLVQLMDQRGLSFGEGTATGG